MNSEKQDLQSYYKLKSEIEMPLKLKIYFSMLENTLSAQGHNPKSQKLSGNKKGFSKALLKAFSSLSTAQKGRFMFMSLNFVVGQFSRLEKGVKKQSNSRKPEMKDINMIQTTCEMLFTTLKIQYWAAIHFKLDKAKKLISINNKKKSFNIDIHQYLVRRSKKHKAAIVLETIYQQITNQNKKYEFNFSSSIVQKIYEQVLECVMDCQQLKMITLINQEDDDEQEDKQSHQSSKSNDHKGLSILTSLNINQYLVSKQKIQKQLFNAKFDIKAVYHQNNIQIVHSNKFQRTYKMQCIIDKYKGNFKQDFLQALYQRNKYIVSTQILQKFSKKYKAAYEKYLINKRIYEMISIRQENNVSNQEDIIFLKVVESLMSKNYIEYLHAKIRHVSPQKMKFIVYMSVGNSSKSKSKKANINQQVVKQFMLELLQMIYRPKFKKQNQQKNMKIMQEESMNKKCSIEQQFDNSEESDEFKTVKGDSDQFVGISQGYDSQQDGVFNDFIGKQEGQKNYPDSNLHKKNLTLLNSNKLFPKVQEHEDIHGPNHVKPLSNQYLTKRYMLGPQDSSTFFENKKLMKEHYLFKQWVRTKMGGVVCINEIKVNVQKNLFKIGLAKLGKKILQGQLLRMSLPIEIFCPQSHLETIARNLSYSPLLFDKLSNTIIKNFNQEQLKKYKIQTKQKLALQRVKSATLLAISVGTMGISIQKPFNPIIGETIQLWIDGCPMYLEQIQHHPSIGAYYFKGRGYVVHGEVEPKISFGLNNIKGYSQRPNLIKFQSEDVNQQQTVIEIIFGKMVIKGLLFGERQFNYESKIYAYDKTNHIFSQIIYGPKKKAKSNMCQAMDFISGKIYKVQPDFLPKFNNSMPRIYPKKQNILQELSKFEGIWNDYMLFDGIEYLNFRTDLPCQVIHEENPLLSNSSYRKDVQRLIEANLPQAQKQKDNMEQLQRKDRKLREAHHHS